MSDWKKKEKKSQDFYIFESPGQELVGVVESLREIATKFGVAKVADLIDENEQDISIIVTSGMNIYAEDVGSKVKIVFIGWQKNPKTGNIYKSFDVFTKPGPEFAESDLPF